MSKYYKFEFANNATRLRGKILAWTWGDWKLAPSWTSDKSPDADYSTENATSGVQRAGNLLMIAVHHRDVSPFNKGATFGALEIHTFEDGNASGTPLRTAAYYSATVLENPIPRDFSNLPINVGKQANYSEVRLKIESVKVFS
jgi:hypothetical protein